MKFIYLSLLGVILILNSCTSTSNNDSEGKDLNTEEDSTNIASNENEVFKTTLSYDSLIFYIENNEQIPCSYILNHAEGDLNCPLDQNILIQESDDYIIVESAYINQAMDSYPYYLCSFSKETAELISFISIGHEAEGVEPNTIRWKSKNEFSMIEYRYDFIEDEESGAYMQGEVNDSIVSKFTIESDGSFTRK